MAFGRMMAVIGVGIAVAAGAGFLAGNGDTGNGEDGPAVTPAAPPPLAPGTLVSGRAAVVSGDTLDLGGRRVRLFGIDAPELAQTCMLDGGSVPCGETAKAALAAMVPGKSVHCTARGDDGGGVVLAVCRVDGRDLGAEMVGAGWAVALPGETDAYVDEESRAGDDHRGLWGGEFLHPAAWRAKNPLLPGAVQKHHD